MNSRVNSLCKVKFVINNNNNNIEEIYGHYSYVDKYK